MRRAKVLHVDLVRADGTRRHEIALVDVCVNTISEIGSRAVWQTATLRELYCTFAEPHAIGLSSHPRAHHADGLVTRQTASPSRSPPAVARHARCWHQSHRDCSSQWGWTAARR